jgi:dihydrofolate synthase/folylpolyglutamate synthase
MLIADGAHNADSARRLKAAITQYFDFQQSILILGTSADKNVAGMVAELAPLCHRVIVTRSHHPRAAAPSVLKAELARQGIKAEARTSVPSAVSSALAMAGEKDLICATGSLFVVAEVIEYIKGRQSS